MIYDLHVMVGAAVFRQRSDDSLNREHVRGAYHHITGRQRDGKRGREGDGGAV